MRPHTQVRPIAVTDVLGRSGTSGAASQLDAGASFVSASVQAFLNNVVMVAAPAQSPEEVRATVAGAFGAVNHPEQKGAVSDDEDAASHSHHAGAPASDSAARKPATARPGTPSHSGAPPPPSHSHSHSPSLVIGGPVGGRSASEAARTAVLQKDAFLVFRALCKLSIRTSDTATVQDPTAARGKVRAGGRGWLQAGLGAMVLCGGLGAAHPGRWAGRRMLCREG